MKSGKLIIAMLVLAHVSNANELQQKYEKAYYLETAKEQAEPAAGIDLIGSWKSVDFVRTVEEFQPGIQKWRGDLFLKELHAYANGTTSFGGLTWKKNLIIHPNGKTIYPYFIEKLNGETYLFLPWLSGDVTDRGEEPWYYVLKSYTVEAFDDVRWKNLSNLDLSNRPDLISTLWFNESMIWPAPENMPDGCDPHHILTNAMNPGLGIRALHQQGITGKGVNVAIIDQPLYQNHPEFDGKFAAYHDVGCDGSKRSMHGPAVASLLVGTQCGTAPGATLYYAAVPSWKGDAAYYATALDWILEQNEHLAEGSKIRVVSVSAAPSGAGSFFKINNDMWDEACARAEAAGMLVLDCTQHRGLIGSCYYDADDPENVTKCTPGYPGIDYLPSRDLLVPSALRTTAEQYVDGTFSYQYCGQGGLSWAIPYCAGVLAMGWQLQPDLTASQMQQILLGSATNGIIHPEAFIESVRQGNPRIQVGDKNFGIQANGFGFNITAPWNGPVVVEACTFLPEGIWAPIKTNTLTEGSVYFNDPDWTNHPACFYRVSTP